MTVPLGGSASAWMELVWIILFTPHFRQASATFRVPSRFTS